MKIVFTVHTYWPQKNGVQYVNQYLAEGLVKRGHEVVVITSHKNNRKRKTQFHNGVKIISLYLETHYSFIVLGAKKYRKEVMRELEDCDCVINSCVQSPNNNLLLSLLDVIPCVKVLYMHGMHDFKHVSIKESSFKYALWHMFMNIRWKIFYVYHKSNFKKYDVMIDIHEKSNAVSFMKKLCELNDVKIIYNAVENFEDIEISEQDIKRYPLLGKKYFIYVANYTNIKNQGMALRAFNKIPNKKDYELLFIGGPSAYEDELKKQVKDLGVDKIVHILDNVDRELTKKYIKNSSCGLMSSRKEVYPIFIAEIMACNKPYISTDVGCICEMPGGIIVSNVDEMTNAMQKIIDDDRLAKKCGNIGYEYSMKNYSQKQKVIQLENIIKESIKNLC